MLETHFSCGLGHSLTTLSSDLIQTLVESNLKEGGRERERGPGNEWLQARSGSICF